MPKLHFIKAGLLTALLAGAAMPALAQPGGDRQGWQSQRAGGEARAPRAENRPTIRPSNGGNRGSVATRPSPTPRIGERTTSTPRIQREATPRPGTPTARPQAPNASPPTGVAPQRPNVRPPAQATPPRTDARPGQQSQRWQNNGPRARPDGDRNRPNTPNWRDRDRDQDRNRDRPGASRDSPGGQDWRDRDRPNQNWRDRDRPGQNWRPPNNRPPATTRPPNRPPVVNRWQGYRPWTNSWRNDRRYDWQYWRRTNRDIFRMPHYYAPYGWSGGYFRFSIGVYLDDLLFGSSYWIDDPYRYRLPPAYGYLRWVRYYDDALLVDIRDGYVVDIVYDVFW